MKKARRRQTSQRILRAFAAKNNRCQTDRTDRLPALQCNIPERGKAMTIHLNFAVQYLLAIIAGVAILVTPKLLNYIVAVYLIAVGVIGILGIKI
jgi:hypothetical protein